MSLDLSLRKTHNLFSERMSCPAVRKLHTIHAIIMFYIFVLFCISHLPLDFNISFMCFHVFISYAIVSVIVCISKTIFSA